MADSTQAAASTPAKVVINMPHMEAFHMTTLAVNVSSYAVGGFPRKDTPPDPMDHTGSFKKFFELVNGGEVTQVILGVDIVSGAAVVARYDDVLDRVKLYNVNTSTGALSEIANGTNVGDIRLRVWYV